MENLSKKINKAFCFIKKQMSEQMSQNPGKVSFVFFTEWYRPGLKWFQSMTKLTNFQKFEIQGKRKCEFLRFVFKAKFCKKNIHLTW